MTTRILYAAALTAILAFTSCDKTEAADPEREHAHALYKELRSVYAAYADSLEHMATAHTDSTRQTDESVSKLVERFEQRLKHVYGRYPADLDIRLTESENDSLWEIARLYIERRNNMTIHTERPDSVPGDTTATKD